MYFEVRTSFPRTWFRAERLRNGSNFEWGRVAVTRVGNARVIPLFFFIDTSTSISLCHAAENGMRARLYYQLISFMQGNHNEWRAWRGTWVFLRARLKAISTLFARTRGVTAALVKAPMCGTESTLRIAQFLWDIDLPLSKHYGKSNRLMSVGTHEMLTAGLRSYRSHSVDKKYLKSLFAAQKYATFKFSFVIITISWWCSSMPPVTADYMSFHFAIVQPCQHLYKYNTCTYSCSNVHGVWYTHYCLSRGKLKY